MPKPIAEVFQGCEPTLEALVTRSGRFTYAELEELCAKATGALATLGVKKGDRVAATLPNDFEVVAAFHATMRLGAIWLGVNKALAPPEKRYIIEDAGASIYLEDAVELRAAIEDAAPRDAVDVDPFAPAGIAYTSGTTGYPKGAVHSQYNLLMPGRMLVESFIPNPTLPAMPAWNAHFVSVEVLACHGTIAALGVTGRFPLAERFQETGQIFPAAVSRPTRDALVDAAIRAVRAMGADLGLLHVEVKWTDAGPVVIEVNGRLGGGHIPEFLQAALGPDFVQVAMRLALGEDLAFEGALDAPQDIGFMLWMHPAPEIRRLTAVEGVAEIEAIPEVRTVVQRIRGGDVVDWGLGSLGNVLDVRGFAPDYETVRRVREKALSALVISGTEEA